MDRIPDLHALEMRPALESLTISGFFRRMHLVNERKLGTRFLSIDMTRRREAAYRGGPQPVSVYTGSQSPLPGGPWYFSEWVSGNLPS